MLKKFNLLIIMLLLFIVGCSNTIEEYVPEKIVAAHHYYDENLLSYIKVSTNLIKEKETIYPKFSITTHAQIAEGTQRKMLYYQVDWISADDSYDTYYYIDNELEKDLRYVGQQFLPFSKINGDRIKTIKALFKYRSTIDGVEKEKELKYLEEMFIYNVEDYKETSSIINDILSFGVVYDNSDNNDYRFKFFINFEEVEKTSSHIDIQSWVETESGEVYPFTGIYHYSTKGRSYKSVSDEKISKDINLNNMYIKLKYNNGSEEIEKNFVYSIR